MPSEMPQINDCSESRRRIDCAYVLNVKWNKYLQKRVANQYSVGKKEGKKEERQAWKEAREREREWGEGGGEGKQLFTKKKTKTKKKTGWVA